MISCIIPAYNCEKFIGAALKSVLAQDIEDLEVIVVNDGSTDRTADICAEFGSQVICVTQKNSGSPAARNRGLNLSRGDFITFLDADDVYMTGGLTLQLQKFQQHPTADLVVGRFIYEAIASLPGEPMVFKPLTTPDEIVLQMGVSLIRRHVFEKVGMFDEGLRSCDDWDWFMRARELKIPMLFHREPVMQHRLHNCNMTRDRSSGNSYMALMFKRSIDRRRKGLGKINTLPNLSDSLE